MNVPQRLTEQQAQNYLPASRDKLKALRRKRLVKFYRIGHRTIVYDRASLDAYLRRSVSANYESNLREV